MDIEQFIETTLTQIIGGVKKAQGKLESEELINPAAMTSHRNAPTQKNYLSDDNNLIHMVEFDIAVTADSSSEAVGKGGLKVAGIGGVEGGGRSVNRDSVVSRVKFQIPITLPFSQKAE